MADDAWAQLEARIEAGDLLGAVAVLERLEEPERKRLSTRAKAAAKPPEYDERRSEREWQRLRDRSDVADGVVFGTGGSAAAARSWWFPWNEPDALERLVRCRPREWRQDWAERLCARGADDGLRFDSWAIIRRLVRDGEIDRPAGPGYVTGAVNAYQWMARDRSGRATPLVEHLRADPEWLATELWRTFEIEESSFTGFDHDDTQPTSWSRALVELAATGEVPRDRLLDEALAALQRDFTPHNARWFHKLVDKLEPTDDELDGRRSTLLGLLASSDPAIVGFALRLVSRLERRSACRPASCSARSARPCSCRRRARRSAP